jgi:glutathione S-transferase
MLALYHNDMSLCAQKVRVCLAEKGLQWENRHLVLRAGEHQQPWYLKLNRRAVVPTLIDGEKIVPESNVILEYLDEAIPNVFKRERRRDVVENGTGSKHFIVAVKRMVLLLDEMEEALAVQQWLACDDYTLADVAFTPYLARLEHLNILGMIGERHRVADWYQRCKARPSFHEAIVKWENADYLGLMERRGTEAWPQVERIMQAL